MTQRLTGIVLGRCVTRRQEAALSEVSAVPPSGHGRRRITPVGSGVLGPVPPTPPVMGDGAPGSGDTVGPVTSSGFLIVAGVDS